MSTIINKYVETQGLKEQKQRSGRHHPAREKVEEWMER